MSNTTVPHDPLASIFTAAVITRLQQRLSRPFATEDERNRLLTRLNILTAGGEYPRALPKYMQHSVRFWRAYKVAWDAYVHAAYVCGLFDGDSGKDLTRRLTDTNNDNFQGAIAECLACWIFAGKLHMPVSPKPNGRNLRTLEFACETPVGTLHIEVKSPYKENPHQVWSGDDAGTIAACIEQANKQFSKSTKNALVMVPDLRLPLFLRRGSLIRALYGEERFVVPLDTATGKASGPTTTQFFPDGRFLKVRASEGKPRFTRTSMVISVEEIYNEHYDFVDHKVLILHNPYAAQSCEALPLDCYPTFKRNDDKIGWSDGHSLY